MPTRLGRPQAVVALITARETNNSLRVNPFVEKFMESRAEAKGEKTLESRFGRANGTVPPQNSSPVSEFTSLFLLNPLEGLEGSAPLIVGCSISYVIENLVIRARILY